MQSAITFAAPSFVPLAPAKSVTTFFPTKLSGSVSSPRSRNVAMKVATLSYDSQTVDYNSMFSVFPAEACETVGGDACLAEIYPEARLQARNDTPPTASENVEREYLEYNDPKTVFLGEACDELGGIFCEHDFQKGVY